MSSKEQTVIQDSEGGILTEAGLAWENLSAIMKDTPLDISPDWLEQVQSRWGAEQGHLILRVPASTDPLWLKRKFLPVANVFFSQLQGGQGHLIVEFEKGAIEEEVRLKAERGAYESVVHPEKVVPVSIYMFQHWLPVLEPSAFWVVLAMRQTAFVSKSASSQVGKRISLRDLARWIPLHYSSVRRAMLREGFLSWFFSQTKDAYEDLPPEYAVFVEYPLAPHHLSWIDNFLQKGIGAGKSLNALLKELLELSREIRQVKPGELDYPPEYARGRRSLLDLVSVYWPDKVDNSVHDLASQLNREITRDYLTVSIPHYFLLRFGDELSANEAALIWYLRSLYLAEEQEKHVFQGYASLAGKVGFGRKTLQRMFERCLQPEDQLDQPSFYSSIYQPEYTLGNWLRLEYLSPHQDGQGREFSLAVRSNEPIHPEDEEKYLSLIEKEYQKAVVISETGGGQIATALSGDVSQSETASGQTEPRGGLTATGEGSEETAPDQTAPLTGDKEKQLNISINNNINQPNNLLDKQPLQPHQMDFWEMEASRDEKGNVVGADLIKLLGFGGYSQKQKKELLPEINKNETYFLAWLIRNHLTKANFPVRLAIRNIQENNTTESKYITLASKGWLRIQQLLEDDFELLDERTEIQELIRDLRETDFPGVLADILPENDPIPDIGAFEENDRIPKVEKDYREIESLYRHGWDVVKGELQMEMKKSDFNTWVNSIQLIEADGGLFVFETSNSYAREWLEQKLSGVLIEKLSPLVRDNGEKQARVKFVCR